MSQKIVADLGQPYAATLSNGHSVDVLLELVDLCVEVVEEVEERSATSSNDVVRDHPGRDVRLAAQTSSTSDGSNGFPSAGVLRTVSTDRRA